jgi:hypothetical protein
LKRTAGMLSVKAETLEDFEAAAPGEYIYGYLLHQKTLSVLVTCGRQKIYNRSPKDSEQTRYKLFMGCSLQVADSNENLDAGNYHVMKDVTVKLYY